MSLLLILAALVIVGIAATAVIVRRDARERIPEIWHYDTRRPIL